MTTPAIFTPKNRAAASIVVKELGEEPLLAVDSEGVQLGKHGPLTLLQIGTLNGKVYLFDVMLNESEQDKRFFSDIGLDSVLTSKEVEKVIHSCSGDSAALFHQFDIRLQNVFDTQVAHLVIAENQGRKLPSRLKLAEVCKTYSSDAVVYEGKDDVKLEWTKLEGNFWAKRPMTKEMIEYASGDVTALIPQVYETQKRYMEENGLMQIFAERVMEEIELDIDSVWKERRRQRNNEATNSVLENMAKKYRTPIGFTSITDEDEKKAIDNTSFKDLANFPEEIRSLKIDSMKHYLISLEKELEDPDTFIAERSLMFKLGEIEREGADTMKDDALRIKKQVFAITVRDIVKKYRSDTPLENISRSEMYIIRALKPLSPDEKHPPTVLAIHWRDAESEIDRTIESIKSDPNSDVSILIGKIKFLASNPDVPLNVKGKVIKLQAILLENIAKKYTINTPLSALSPVEKSVLENLQVKSQTYSPVVLALHWEITYENLCDTMDSLRTGRLNAGDGLNKKLTFLTKYSVVPMKVKQKASELLAGLPRNPNQ